jgi:hypothetical protein
MEYREIRYTVRTRIERNEWTVSIHPAGIESPRIVVTGPRVRADLLARCMIDRWHDRTARTAARSRALIRAADRRRLNAFPAVAPNDPASTVVSIASRALPDGQRRTN